MSEHPYKRKRPAPDDDRARELCFWVALARADMLAAPTVDNVDSHARAVNRYRRAYGLRNFTREEHATIIDRYHHVRPVD